ncbi:hypothetical protein B6D03_13545 [Gilliamella apicola]|nr:hypothetical protein B6D03_13545 [Gilliamella apicola]
MLLFEDILTFQYLRRPGRRIGKHQIDRESKPYNRTRFLWDGLRMIQETGPNHPTSLYIYTDQNSYEPLARIDRTGNQEQHIYYFHTDLNGLPEELTDEVGEIVWECSYQLWGKPIQEIAHTEIQQNLRYQGQYLDRETGLHYNTFRYYDPDIGRFTQPDPIGLLGGLNLYQYAPNGLTWIDPLGLILLYRGMNLAEYDELMKTGKWTSPPSTLEGKWFAESYKDAVTWGEKMGHGGDFRVVQVSVPDNIADAAYKNPRLDGIGKARFIDNVVLNKAKIKPKWSKYIHQPKC